MATTLGWITLALPLAGFLILALWPGEPSKRVSAAVGCGSILGGFGCAAAIFLGLLGDSPEERTHVSRLWTWIDLGDLRVDAAIQIDQLSVLMMLVITGVGFLIHLYSAEYMAGSRGYRRFYAEMNFFVFSMLLLVEAANVLFLIIGWALVGLASYLLIGFDHDRPAAVAAAKKAFVVNVVGDIGMVLAAVLLIRELGTLDYGAVFAAAPAGLGQGTGVAEAVALLLFVGAAAKSAQVPFHTWLPDAMEGPTPVSALIHAATMVTAGVYLVVRMHVLYQLAPIAADTVAVVGAITLFMAATIAIVQVDIKRVLAWSTVSQIGYMIMGAGLGVYGGAMFHFLEHAFFKALLFLGVGIVIHALAGEQSLDRMGGLSRHLRFAYVTVAIGCLAIAGFPGLSGFFSKDAILSGALADGALGKTLWVVGTLTAGLTALYMFRMLFRAFWGPEPAGGYAHPPHPSGPLMAVPVAVLAVLSVVGGWIEVPGAWHGIDDWLHPVFADSVGAALVASGTDELITGICSSVLCIAGIAAAWWLFARDPSRRLRLAGVARPARGVLEEGYRFDEAYDEILVNSTRDVGDVLRRRVEPAGVQGLVTATVAGMRESAKGLQKAQSGLLRTYAFMIVLGLALVGVVLALAIH
ncbi:MAG: NADH-quinone oxidoreductase subunit [Miltoncostaeaceae bacterium]|nr:NADH-quinone oxidoreductase subunit [Miltoncostaeaceae bacterium]